MRNDKLYCVFARSHTSGRPAENFAVAVWVVGSCECPVSGDDEEKLPSNLLRICDIIFA